MLLLVGLLATQSPEALDLLDRLDVASGYEAVTIDLDDDPGSLTGLVFDLDDLSLQLPSRSRAIGLVAHWRERWSETDEHRARALEISLVLDLGALFYPTAAAQPTPRTELERIERCEALAAVVGGVVERAYRCAAIAALECGVGR